MPDDAVSYYREFLAGRSWYAEALSWTVIQPAHGGITEDEVIRRLRGERVVLADIRFPHVNDWRPGMPDEMKVAYLRQVGPAVVMFQPNGFEATRPEVLRWLSADVRVHNVDWTISGNGSINYAVYGRLLARIDKNHPDRRSGDDPSVLDEDLAELREARRIWEEDGVGAAEIEPKAMAFVERRTGVRLDVDWVDSLDDRGPAVMIGNIPNDPRPPSRFGYGEPDLDARLRAASDETRRGALLLALRELTEWFEFGDAADAVTAAIDAVERGVPLDQAVRTRLFLAQGKMDGDQGRAAVLAFYQVTSPPRASDDPLDALSSARHALPTQWPRLRRAIDDVLRGR